MKRIVPLILILSLSAITSTACFNNNRIDPISLPGPPAPIIIAPESESNQTPDSGLPESESVSEPGPDFINPLTGMGTWTDVSNNRPIAIMINNIRTGLPQHGISRADIIYETMVEGGLTRNLAVFQDISSVGIIGSIRSARPYFVDIAQGHDAILMHAGGSPDTIRLIRSRKINNIDDLNGPRGRNVFFRDQSRRSRLGSEHSLMTSGERIANELAGFGYRLEHEPDYKHTLRFLADGIPVRGFSATRVDVVFSGAKSTTFIYDEASNLYYVEQYGMPSIDANDDTQLSVTNVIVINTSISNIPGDNRNRQRVITEGTGSGYYINGGKNTEITWTRNRITDPFTFTLPDTSILDLGTGRTYICIIPLSATPRFE